MVGNGTDRPCAGRRRRCCGRGCATYSVSRCRSSAHRTGRSSRSTSLPPCAGRGPSAVWARRCAINHTLRPLNEEAFQATLDERPAAVSFHLGVPGDLIERAHDAGILWIQQVMDVQQAEQAVGAGADVIVAQGGEAGGQGGEVATMVLVPQVVDIAGDTPVVAAGGIADGRGLAAALALGARSTPR
ncbi:nitronate monooxygenase [Streptomyces afghaniensis]|uniref:nitronate monooxygenase n=1 Tax=Streptomyces afghaniensis TaxID=66865 RepID=UPI0037B8D6E9